MGCNLHASGNCRHFAAICGLYFVLPARRNIFFNNSCGIYAYQLNFSDVYLVKGLLKVGKNIVYMLGAYG